MGKSSSEKKLKKKHKHKRKKAHKEKNESKKLKKSMKSKNTEKEQEDGRSSPEDFAIPIALMNNKSHAPETPEEYQRRQSQIRREVDPVTGRTRLIKGDGEVLEEIVTKERHTQINKMATQGDAKFFEEESFAAAKKSKRK